MFEKVLLVIFFGLLMAVTSCKSKSIGSQDEKPAVLKEYEKTHTHPTDK